MGIDVERAFNEAVRRAGGQRVDELGIPDLSATKNSDYVFKGEGVVAELKRLVSENPRLTEKLSDKYNELANAGLVPVMYGGMMVSFRDLPPKAAEEMTNVLLPMVERRVRDADRQLAQTKSGLGMPDAAGLLILCHNGNFALDPDGVMSLVGRAFRDDRRPAIDHVIYFVCDMEIRSTTGELIVPWVSTFRAGRQRVASALLDRLRDSWITIEAGLRGRPYRLEKTVDPVKLDDLKFTRR